jgi:multiple sugar transport system permease protein
MRNRTYYRTINAGKGVGKYLALILILLWSGLPIILIMLSSIKVPRDIFNFPPSLFFKPYFGSYVELARNWPEFFKTMWNSTFITVGSALLTITLSFLAGYALSRYRNRTMSVSAFTIIFTRLMPPIIISIPLYPLINQLRMFDKPITLIIFYTTFFVSLGTILMKTFIDQIPKEIEESAAMDGATLWMILRKLILPLSIQGLVAVSTFIIIFAWNEYTFAFLFTTTQSKTAPLIISEMMGSVTGVMWGPLFAAATLQLIPILIYVFAIQKFLVEGATAGAVKG